MNSDFNNRVLAFAGIFQAAYLADRIAQTGMADSSAMEASIYSILQTDAEDIYAVFNGKQGLSTGLRKIVQTMSDHKLGNNHVNRYVRQMIYLAEKLEKNPQALSKISSGIDIAQTRAEIFDLLHTNLLSQLADLYSDNISPLGAKIMIKGEPLHLNNPDNASKIRALLLAGVRSAILWRQCGGRKLQLLLSLKKMFNTAKQLLNE